MNALLLLGQFLQRPIQVRKPDTPALQHAYTARMETKDYYHALISRDARFDGRFFVGVTSTGIYCRPICRVRKPRLENCRFFTAAALAEAQGFRPCLRCRPEQAPSWSQMDAVPMLARQAVQLIQQANLQTTAELAAKLGVSERHLRRLFKTTYGIAPSHYLRTQRLLAAKLLLTDTLLSVEQIANSVGFGSRSQFYQQFKNHYQLTPTTWRRTKAAQAEVLSFQLSYRPPFDWTHLLNYFQMRCLTGVEQVTGNTYQRTVALYDARQALHQGWLTLKPSTTPNTLELCLSDSLYSVIPAVLARVRALGDLDCDPMPITAQLDALADAAPGLRVPGTWDGFEIAVRAVIGQLITVKAACTLTSRLVRLANKTITTPWPSLHLRFPLAAEFLELSSDALAQQGMQRRHSAALQQIAQHIVAGELRLDASADYHATYQQLLSIKGIGAWTANYIAMRALRWPDAFLAGDYGVKKALGTASAREAEAKAKAWQPWRSYAVMHLWRQLS